MFLFVALEWYIDPPKVDLVTSKSWSGFDEYVVFMACLVDSMLVYLGVKNFTFEVDKDNFVFMLMSAFYSFFLFWLLNF